MTTWATNENRLALSAAERMASSLVNVTAALVHFVRRSNSQWHSRFITA